MFDDIVRAFMKNSALRKVTEVIRAKALPKLVHQISTLHQPLFFTTFYIHSRTYVGNTPLNHCPDSSLSSSRSHFLNSSLDPLSFTRVSSLSVTRTTVTMPEGEVVQAKKSFMGMPGFVVDFLSKSSDQKTQSCRTLLDGDF